LINYSENYEKIIDLTTKYFSLDEDSKDIFIQRMREGSVVDDSIKKHFNKDFRIEKNLTVKELEVFDESWQIFKYSFGEYCVDTGITYSEFLIGNRTNQKNVSKITKDLKKYYSKRNNTIYRSVNHLESIDHTLNSINNYRLPRKKLKLVITFNLSDMFMCSSGQEWTSCLNLKSEYFGAYWLGLASLPFDKNRGMIYLTYQKENSTECYGITSEKMFKRTFFLIDNNDVFNILKWYPNEFQTNRHIDSLNAIFHNFSFREIDESFNAKHLIEDFPKITKDGKTTEFYIYQDKTEINKSEGRIYFTGGKGNQYFVNEVNNFGQFLSCEGGIYRMNNESTRVYDYIQSSFTCCRCGGIYNENELRVSNGDNYCRQCYEENIVYCEHCGSEVRTEDYNFDYDMCNYCYSERASDAI